MITTIKTTPKRKEYGLGELEKSGGEAAGASFLRTSRLRALVVDV